MTRAQLLLTSVAEEAVEVAQRATKALRFGLGEVQAGQELDNATRLGHELAELLAVVEMVEQETGVVVLPPAASLAGLARAKRAKVEQYLALSAREGVLDQ